MVDPPLTAFPTPKHLSHSGSRRGRQEASVASSSMFAIATDTCEQEESSSSEEYEACHQRQQHGALSNHLREQGQHIDPMILLPGRSTHSRAAISTGAASISSVSQSEFTMPSIQSSDTDKRSKPPYSCLQSALRRTSSSTVEEENPLPNQKRQPPPILSSSTASSLPTTTSSSSAHKRVQIMEPSAFSVAASDKHDAIEVITTQQSLSRIRRRRSIGSANSSNSNCSSRNDEIEERRSRQHDNDEHQHEHDAPPIRFLRKCGTAAAAGAGAGLTGNVSGHSASKPSGHRRGSMAQSIGTSTGHSSMTGDSHLGNGRTGPTISGSSRHSRRSSNDQSSYSSRQSRHSHTSRSSRSGQMSGSRGSHHRSSPSRSSNRRDDHDDDDDDDDYDGEQSASRCSDSRTSASSKQMQQREKMLISSSHTNHEHHLQPLLQLKQQHQGLSNGLNNNNDGRHQQSPLVPHMQQQNDAIGVTMSPSADDNDDDHENPDDDNNKRSLRDKLMKELKSLPSQRYWDDDMTFSRPSTIFRRIRLWCGFFVNLAVSQIFIIVLIIINALMMGVATFDFVTEDPHVDYIFEQIDKAFLCIFTIEMILHLVYRCLSFFQDAWLIFDMIIVVFSWSLQSMQVIRAFRIFRALRLVTRISSLRELVLAIAAVMPRMYCITMLLLLMFYIFAVLFTELFSDLVLTGSYFGTLDQSLFTCMSLMTLEWADVAREVMEQRPWAWAPISAFIAISGFIVFNLIVAVVCDAVKTTGDEEYAARHPGQYRNHDYRYRGDSNCSMYMEDEMSRQPSVRDQDSFALKAALEESDAGDDANLIAFLETQERIWEVSQIIKTLSDRQTELQGIVANLGEELRLLQKCTLNPIAQPLSPSTILDSVTTSSASTSTSLARPGDFQNPAACFSPLKNDNLTLSRLGKTRGGWHFPSPHESPDSSSGIKRQQEHQHLRSRSVKIEAPPLTSTIESARQRLVGRPSSLVANPHRAILPAAAERQRRLELHADNSKSNHSSDHHHNDNIRYEEETESSLSIGGSQSDNECRENAIYSVTLGLLPQLLEESRTTEVSSSVSSTGADDDDDGHESASSSSPTITSYTGSHSWLDDVPTLATVTSPGETETIDDHDQTTNKKSTSGDSKQNEQQEPHNSFSRNTYSSGSESDMLLLENICNTEGQSLPETNVADSSLLTEFPSAPSTGEEESTENTESARYFF